MGSTSSSLALAATILLVASSVPAQDFDPGGRHRPAASPAPRAAASAPHSTEGSTPAVLLDRYTKIVIAQPGAPFPLQRLAQLYRDRDGNLRALVADLQKRASDPGPDQYGAAVGLAGVDKLDGRLEDAAKMYERAISLKQDDPSAVMALAHLLQDRGDVAAARTRFEQVLALQKAAIDRGQTLRTLMELALDAKDYDAAKAAHLRIVRLEPSSLFAKGELGRELLTRGEYVRAEVELKELVVAAAGDNRALAPALKDLGRAQAKAHENTDALATLKRALSAAGAEAAVRAEIYQSITEVYRAEEQLPLFVKELEDEHVSDFARLALLGSLYEETGDAARAVATYRKALAANPRQIDLRLKMVRLLQARGELDRAIEEYEALVRSAPNNAQFVFEMCDALIQRGDRARALRLLKEIEARAVGDEEVLGRLGEFYARIGEGDRSLHVLTRLAEIGASDPSHLVDLGDHYYQGGNTALAVSTWKRILSTVSPRARALAALGDVYLEHEMAADAIVALREAVQLDASNVGYEKALASALEHSKNYREAHFYWRDLAAKAKEKGDVSLAREARTHSVTLWGLEHALEPEVSPLRVAFQGQPPDLDAGRTLAEVLVHLRRLPETEATLRRVLLLAPGDVESYLALERVLVQEGKLDEAIFALERLVAIEPKRAREIYQRMAQYALQIYKDDDAIKYAARAVELNPEDAEGHRRLAEMYRSRQNVEQAIGEFRAAILKNERAYLVYFELADLLLSKGEVDEADQLFRRVVRGAPDEDLVAQAARLSMQINLGKGTLESLELDLLPLAIGNPQKTIYRRLLVEIYESLTFGLVQRIRHGTLADAAQARAALSRVGQRAVKPLLDALADGDAGQQRVAIDVLGYVENRNAAPALFSFATGTAGTPLRVEAMIACGSLRAPDLLPRYQAFLFPKDEEAGPDAPRADSVAIAASWGVARMVDRQAIPLLRALSRHGSPEERAIAVLGLSLVHARDAIPEVAQIAKAIDAGNLARAAAAYALGEFGAESEVATLIALAESADALPRQMALIALARLGAGRAELPGGRAALGAMTDAVFASGDPSGGRSRANALAIQRAGSHALMLLASGRDSAARAAVEALLPPEGALDVESELEHLVPDDFSAKERALVLTRFGDALEHSAVAAIETSGDGALAVIDALGEGTGTMEPFVGPHDDFANARAKASDIARALEPSILELTHHFDPTVRMKAVVMLSRSSSDASASAVVQATRDASEAVQRFAFAAIGAHPSVEAIQVVTRALEHHDSWAIRVLAAKALGRFGAAGGGEEVSRVLSSSATHDDYALVREAALNALASFDTAGGQKVAVQLAATDPEPRVRETARAISSRALK